VSEPSVSSGRTGATRGIPPGPRLFDSKYVGSFNTHTECVAFVKGVEAVLNYMLEAKDVKGLRIVRDHMLEAKEFEIPAKPAQ
jgi:hypothetical protein